jgi:hypothetical protein
MRWQLSPRVRAALHAVVQWGGETSVGLIPLLAFEMMHRYASVRADIFRCTDTKPPFFSGCIPVVESVSQEMCILTVVISGLSLLSVVNIGPTRRQATNTVLTYVLIVMTILALLGGMLLYAIFGAHIDREAGGVTAGVLGLALAGSLFLALEGAILDA